MKQYTYIILEDWKLLTDRKITPQTFCERNWEKFKNVYISVYHNDDWGTLWLRLQEIMTKIYNTDISPYFKSDEQLYNYVKTALYYDRQHIIRNLDRQIDRETVSLANLAETDVDLIEELADNNVENLPDYKTNENFLFAKLETLLTPHQMQLVALLYQGYTMKECADILGIGLNNCYKILTKDCKQKILSMKEN